MGVNIMTVTEKLNSNYSNQIKLIKNEKNRELKKRLVGSLALDVGGNCILAIAKATGCSWRFVKKSYLFAKNDFQLSPKVETRGRSYFSKFKRCYRYNCY